MNTRRRLPFVLLGFLVMAPIPLNAQEIKVEYDRFTKKTIISTDGFVYGPQKFYAGFECPGKEVICRPQSVQGAFNTISDHGWFYLRNHDLIFLLNGEEPIEIAETSHTGDVIRGASVTETISFSIPWSEFVRIANASTVEYRLGGYAERLAPKHQAAIRAMVDLVNSSQ